MKRDTFKPNENRYIGIDPGSYQMGVSVVEKVRGEYECIYCGHIKAPKASLTQRLSYIRQEFEKIILEFQPGFSCVEKVFQGVNPKTAFVLGHSRGTILSVIGDYKINLIECAPKSVKKNITGNGNSSKEEVQAFLANYFEIENFISLDASDSLALATYAAMSFNTNLYQMQGVEV